NMQEVVREIFLDHIALVPKAYDELMDPMGAVDLHDVPQHRIAADFRHRLWLDGCFLRQPRPQSARKNDRLHANRPLYRAALRRPSTLPLPSIAFQKSKYFCELVRENSAMNSATSASMSWNDSLPADVLHFA